MLPCFELCGAQGWISWEENSDTIAGAWDHDTVEWFTVLCLPLVPRRAFHTFGWSVNIELTHFGPHFHLARDSSFQVHPIRLSASLVARSFRRRWVYVFAIGGLFLAILGTRLSDQIGQFVVAGVGMALSALSIVCVIWLKITESRTRKIRRLLGPHSRGSSDPAGWTDEDCAQLPEARQAFGVPSYEQAVDLSLEQENYSGAIWASRICAVKEDRWRGEHPTARVLHDPRVKRLLMSAEDNPKAWLEALRARRKHDMMILIDPGFTKAK